MQYLVNPHTCGCEVWGLGKELKYPPKVSSVLRMCGKKVKSGLTPCDRPKPSPGSRNEYKTGNRGLSTRTTWGNSLGQLTGGTGQGLKTKKKNKKHGGQLGLTRKKLVPKSTSVIGDQKYPQDKKKRKRYCKYE